MSDGTRVKLTLPPWHIPYLEKHKIMEVLHELSRELVIQQPVDHLMFVKQLLERAVKNIGLSRIIILSSPRVNTIEVANQIAQQTHHRVVTEEMILANLNLSSREELRPGALAMCLSYLLHTVEAQSNSWILVECIKTAEEARKILQAGVIPTHVLHLIPPFCPSLQQNLYCNVHESWPKYKRDIMHVREVFKNKVVEIFLRQRLIHEVVTECIDVIKHLKRLGCPKQIRVVILGPRGSGKNTQANLIAEKLNLVHINFQFLLCQAWNSDGELNDSLRAADREICFRPDLLAQVINKRILEEDCLTKGWVLTGYPFNIADFKYLDTLDTPPNRVIFLECDLSVCRERITNRRINPYTGAISNITKLSDKDDINELKIHPRDKPSLIEAEITYYCEQYGPMRNYCGETAYVINGDQPERWVYETILAAIIKENLTAEPRNPCVQDDKRSELSSQVTTNSTSSVSTVTPTQIFASYINKL